MKTLNISIDLGLTLLDNTKDKICVGGLGDYVYPLFPGAEGAIRGWARSLPGHDGHKLSIISKIDPGDETRVVQNLFHWGLVPWAISASNVHFCYKRETKATIARLVTHSDVHIDDSVEVTNFTAAAGIAHNILFTGAHDDRENEKLTAPNVHIAHTWDEIWKIVHDLSL